MLCVDDISALWLWRLFVNPEFLLEKGALRSSPLDARPLRRSDFNWEVSHLPKLPVPWHFMVPDDSCRYVRDQFAYTVCNRALPRGSFYQLDDYLCLASPELVFLQMARSLPLSLLVKLGDELCGTYRPIDDGSEQAGRRKHVLTDKQRLQDFLDAAKGMHGVDSARKAAPFIVERSASARESEFEMIACFPPRLRGYGLPVALMNERVEYDDDARLLAGASYALCDLCWPKARLDVEYDGHFHDDAARFSKDKARANALQHMGYRVITVSRNEFNDMRKLDTIIREIAKHIGYRLRDKAPDASLNRRQLHAELLQSERHPLFRTLSVTSEVDAFSDGFFL